MAVLKKWWVLLLQGILMSVLGYFFINHPEEVLLAVSFWAALFVTVTGGLGIIGWLGSNKEEREGGMLLWSLLTLVAGLLMLFKIGVTAKSITIILGLWVIVTGLWLMSAGWSFRTRSAFGYLVALLGLLAAISGFSILFDLHKGAMWMSTLLGLEAIITGIALIFMALVKRKVVGNIKDKVAELRQQ